MTHEKGLAASSIDRADVHVSTMTMHPQFSDPATIASETAIVRQDLGYDATIDFRDDGWDSRVYLADKGETVYKFPRTLAVDYTHETAALALIATVDSPVATQRLEHIDPKGRFVRYKGLVGAQLSELLPEMSETEKLRIGNLVGLFLRSLHALDMLDAKVININDEIAEYRAKYQLALPTLATNLAADEQEVVTLFFDDTVASAMQDLGHTSVLSHGDLGTYNILIDANGKPGVIDFGNIGFYDASKDFIDLWDQTLFEAMLETYGDSKILRARAAVRMLALPVIDVVYYKSKNDDTGLQVTLDRVRSALPAMSRAKK